VILVFRIAIVFYVQHVDCDSRTVLVWQLEWHPPWKLCSECRIFGLS